ncbi:MarR family transcriptional regulator [Escherichia coli]|uniref:MarR family transcriptional regulator n=1 Tax=Escherichia coli TaxID=562 RepID=UPI0010EB44D2|nr:MarR family transcriptional regulator [Escherichia coli]GDM17454.1 transcriptional repressor [Escherichia coli]
MEKYDSLKEILTYQHKREQDYPLQEHYLTQLSMRMNYKMKQTLSMVLNDYRINESMYMTMIILSNQNGNSVSPSDISHILDCSRTNITRITDALEKKGYIQRVINSNDRRAIYIQLTDKGAGFLQQVTDTQKHHLKNMWSVLSETEITALEHINRKLLQHFSLF